MPAAPDRRTHARLYTYDLHAAALAVTERPEGACALAPQGEHQPVTDIQPVTDSNVKIKQRKDHGRLHAEPPARLQQPEQARHPAAPGGRGLRAARAQRTLVHVDEIESLEGVGVATRRISRNISASGVVAVRLSCREHFGSWHAAASQPRATNDEVDEPQGLGCRTACRSCDVCVCSDPGSRGVCHTLIFRTHST